MPRTEVLLFRCEDGSIPFMAWWHGLNPGARVKCAVRIKRLMDRGHELRRPDVDYLRDGIYELRARFEKIQIRMLYFFNGSHVVVLSHGFTKRDVVPAREIHLASARRMLVEQDANRYCCRRAI